MDNDNNSNLESDFYSLDEDKKISKRFLGNKMRRMSETIREEEENGNKEVNGNKNRKGTIWKKGCTKGGLEWDGKFFR